MQVTGISTFLDQEKEIQNNQPEIENVKKV